MSDLRHSVKHATWCKCDECMLICVRDELTVEQAQRRHHEDIAHQAITLLCEIRDGDCTCDVQTIMTECPGCEPTLAADEFLRDVDQEPK